MELWGKFWYLASRALSSRYFFLHFNVNLWPKRRRCSVPLKSLRLIAAPLAFPSISLRLWRVLFLLAKKWCFQKQAWNLKTCYVLHCRRMQRCWALWTLSGWHKYIFIISTPKSTNHSRTSIEGREMYSISYLDDRFYLYSLQIDHVIKM